MLMSPSQLSRNSVEEAAGEDRPSQKNWQNIAVISSG